MDTRNTDSALSNSCKARNETAALCVTRLPFCLTPAWLEKERDSVAIPFLRKGSLLSAKRSLRTFCD